MSHLRWSGTIFQHSQWKSGNLILEVEWEPRGLSRLLHTELHWMDVPERVVYKLGVMVFNCLHDQAPQYLVELCQPVAGVASRQHLRPATWQLLVILHHQLSSYGRGAFCVAGPLVWNSLPDSLQDPIIGGNSFRQSLKAFLFAAYWCIQCIRSFTTMRYINRLFTYLLNVYRLMLRWVREWSSWNFSVLKDIIQYLVMSNDEHDRFTSSFQLCHNSADWRHPRPTSSS